MRPVGKMRSKGLNSAHELMLRCVKIIYFEESVIEQTVIVTKDKTAFASIAQALKDI